MQFLKDIFSGTDAIYVQQKEGHMKNSWLIWFLVVGVVITVLVAFNYQDDQGSIPLSEIFPETQESYPVNIEYEFVDEADTTASAEQAKKIDVVQSQPSEPAVELEKKEETAQESVAAVQEKVSEVSKKVEEVAVVTTEAAKTLGNYSIQVASFKKQERAQQKVGELAKKELEAFVLARDLKDKGTWYRVYVGQFDSKADANDSLANVRKVAADSFIISLK